MIYSEPKTQFFCKKNRILQALGQASQLFQSNRISPCDLNARTPMPGAELCDKVLSRPSSVMKIVSIRVISDSEVPLRPIHRKWVFELEEGVIDADGTLLCPTCRCCSLKQVPKLFPDLLGRPTEVLVWVCPTGCTKARYSKMNLSNCAWQNV